MQMTIQEIKNAIRYNELNSIETLQAAYTGIKHNNDGIIQTLGYDDLSNIVMMLRYIAEKCELLRRRTNSIYDAFAAFNLRETIFDTVDEYQKEMNNKIRQTLAARKQRLFLITQNRTRRTKRSLETMKGDIS